MKKPCILRIVSDILLHQAALAEILNEPQVIDMSRRKYIHSEIQRNAADFRRLVDEFQVQVEPRELLKA
jgi:hypothetical protein